jgi:hypothetical protein
MDALPFALETKRVVGQPLFVQNEQPPETALLSIIYPNCAACERMRYVPMGILWSNGKLTLE